MANTTILVYGMTVFWQYNLKRGVVEGIYDKVNFYLLWELLGEVDHSL